MYMAKDMDSMPHLTAEDRKRLGITLCGMNLKTPVIGASGTYGFGMEYGDFIDRVITNPLVTQVKLYDLEDNLNRDRIPYPTERDERRFAKYEKYHRVVAARLTEYRLQGLM